jgi:HlyD family secretion protein
MPNSQNKNGKRRGRIWLGVVALLLVAGALGLTAALRPSHSIDSSKLASVERGDIAKSVVATGTIEPLTKVEIKSKASGIVKKLLVDYGDRVKTGQVLVELDKEQLEDRVREEEANLAAARASVESAEATYQRNRVDAEGPDVPFLKAAADRDRKLAVDGLVSASAVDDAERAYQLALNKQMSAQRSVAVSKADVARAKAQVAQADAALGGARQDLDNSTIVSPMDGIVLSRDVEVGDAVSSILVLGSEATKIMTLGDMSTVYVLGKVDQADIGGVYQGQPARITVQSFKDKKFNGRVTKISPMGVEKDNVTTFEVRVSIQNPTGELKANMSANAELIQQEKHHVLLIPEAAVIYDKDRHSFVETPDPKADNGKRKLSVQLGISNGITTEIEAGLTEGQKVVLQ